jgi:hypothetical protein
MSLIFRLLGNISVEPGFRFITFIYFKQQITSQVEGKPESVAWLWSQALAVPHPLLPKVNAMLFFERWKDPKDTLYKPLRQ